MAKRKSGRRITTQATARTGLTAANANKHFLVVPDVRFTTGLNDLPVYTLSGTTADQTAAFGEYQTFEKGKASIEVKEMIVRASAAYAAIDNGSSIQTSTTAGVAKKKAPDGVYSIQGGGVVNIDGADVNVYKVVRL